MKYTSSINLEFFHESPPLQLSQKPQYHHGSFLFLLPAKSHVIDFTDFIRFFQDLPASQLITLQSLP